MTLANFIQIFIVFVVLFILIVGFSLFELYTQIGRYQTYWHKQNASLESSKTIEYVALGDSTAQAIGATKPQNGYVGVIEKALSKKAGHQVKAVNLSKTGGKLDDALNRQLPALEKLAITKKTVITIEMGANDMVDFSPQRFEKQMNTLMAKLPAQTAISDIPYFGGGRLRSKEKNVIQANKIMYKLAKKHGFQLAPLHDKIASHGNLRVFAVDWFHPSNYAYKKIWAPVFLERIKT